MNDGYYLTIGVIGYRAAKNSAPQAFLLLIDTSIEQIKSYQYLMFYLHVPFSESSRFMCRYWRTCWRNCWHSHWVLLCLLSLMLITACGGSNHADNASTETSRSSNSSASTSVSSTSSSSTANSSKRSQNSSSSSSRNLIYYGDAALQFGELRLPPTSDNNPLPLVIIIHGGCWVTSIADYRFMDNFSAAITALGYATWNIEYRAIGTGGEWPVIFQDVGQAVDYVEILAQSYAIDTTKVAIVGHSAGGHLALWAASRQQIPNNSVLYKSNPLPIKGVMSLAGIANVLGTNSCNTLANDVIGVPITEFNNDLFSRLNETSPLQMLPTNINTILISGSDDTIVPPAMGDEYANSAIAANDASSHTILQGFDHFDLINPKNSYWSFYAASLEHIFSE